MDMNLKDIERVLYFEAIQLQSSMTDLIKQLLTEEAYMEAVDKYGDDLKNIDGC